MVSLFYFVFSGYLVRTNQKVLKRPFGEATFLNINIISLDYFSVSLVFCLKPNQKMQGLNADCSHDIIMMSLFYLIGVSYLC